MLCCHGLNNMLASAGERGLSIVVGERLPGGYGFYLQSRGVDYSKIDVLRANPGERDLMINIECQMGVKFCPWCGANLVELSAQRRSELQELARKHKKYDIE